MESVGFWVVLNVLFFWSVANPELYQSLEIVKIDKAERKGDDLFCLSSSWLDYRQKFRQY